MSATNATERIVIAGAGFGGVRLARQLSRRPGLSITLISPEPDFTFYPQLYHAATGGMRAESALPLSELFAGSPVTLVRDRVVQLDGVARTIILESGQSLNYDQLVLALGSVTNYFGIKGLAEFSYDIKSVEGAERFKRHLHRQLVEERRPEVDYVVVGGGPTGVELAAALGDYLRRIVRQHGARPLTYHIDLIEAAPHLLPRLPTKIGRRVEQRLRRLGVKVMTGTAVEAETADSLRLQGETITTHTVIWTAGVANHPFYAVNATQFSLAKNGRVTVDEHLEARPEVYVIGDNADTHYSGLAQTAVHDADYVADDIGKKLAGRDRPPYRPQAPINVIPVGRHWAAVQWGRLQIYGWPGWVLRRLGDLRAYADIAAWPQAVRVWLQDGRRQDDCPICK